MRVEAASASVMMDELAGDGETVCWAKRARSRAKSADWPQVAFVRNGVEPMAACGGSSLPFVPSMRRATRAK